MAEDGDWAGMAARFDSVDIRGSVPRGASESSISATIQKATLLDAPSKLELNPEDIEIGKPLGKGAFGVVYKGLLHGKGVAVKKLHINKFDEDSQEEFRTEMAIMSKIRHPNVILFMGCVMQPGNYMLITELMPRGSLYDVLHDKKLQLPFKRKMKMAKDAALGMNWLHCSTPVFIHRDLKTQNLLVDENWTVKVADFGLSHMKRHDKPGQGGSYGSIGTPLWMAPEVLRNQEYDESADVYSFGIVLWELYTQKDPFTGIESFSGMMNSVVEAGHRPEIPKDCPKKLRKLIEACWKENPKERPKFSQMIGLFDTIIVEAVIRDEMGCKMWKKYFLGQKLRESVSWKNFTIALTSFFKVPYPKDAAADTRWKCLKELLLEKSSDRVSMEQFSRILEWFGPMTDLRAFLERVESMLRRPWFHGEISAPQAEQKLLLQKKKGTFLVRFSARDPGCYAISAISGEGVKHYRVYHKPGLSYLVGSTECDTLEDFITQYNKSLGLKYMCPGSPYQSIFLEDDLQACGGYDIPEDLY